MRAAPTKSYSPYIGVASFLKCLKLMSEGKLEIDSFYFILFLIFSNYLTNEEKLRTYYAIISFGRFFVIVY
jgi:hypothetical protein